MSMSKTFIGGAVCREFESEVPDVAQCLLYWHCLKLKMAAQSEVTAFPPILLMQY